MNYYTVKTIRRRGDRYSSFPTADEAEARAIYDGQYIGVGTTRAELWSGTWDSTTWTDGELLASKP